MQIAILGFGTVGRGVYDMLVKDHPQINVKYILDRHPEKTSGVLATVTEDYETILQDKTIDVVVELLGGKDNAYPYVKRAITNGKHVVTANKALVSACFRDLTDLACKHQVQLRYEASVGAAINIIDPLYTIAQINHIQRIEGIINGSTNFVLTALFDHHQSLDEALKKAYEQGYLEAHSNDDMDGLDLMRKINILSMIAYHQVIDEKDILRMPLSKITPSFYDYVKTKGWMMKYMAYSSINGHELSLSVLPVIMEKTHPYAFVKDTDNAITLYGAYHKKQQFSGCGAGRYPTASAVIYDLLQIKQGNKTRVTLNQKRQVVMDHQKARFLAIKQEELSIIYSTLETIINDQSIDCFARLDVDTLNI